MIRRIEIKEVLQNYKEIGIGNEIMLKGWVRTKRKGKQVRFLALNDGSTVKSIQIIADTEKFDNQLISDISTGTSLKVIGTLVESMGEEQAIEVLAREIEIYGKADPVRYPLQKKEHSREYLREIAHLRPRTATFSSVLRMRHAMTFAIHKFFNERGFFNVHTPIITGSDAEGAGEMFQVTTLDLLKLPMTKEGEIDFKQDFFGHATNLTVSGQLEGELCATAIGKIYTFGPTFRAEKSNTPRHLAEFWMIEPEMAFYDIYDNMNLAEEFLKYLIQYALDNNYDELEYLNTQTEDGRLIDRLKFVVENEFGRITYTEAIEILEKADKKFEFPVKWGIDLQSEHERYLVEQHFKKPVMVTAYPKEIKAFYMKMNDDQKTVRALDVLFPQIGEIIGGSEREDNYEVLLSKMQAAHVPVKEMDWYLDTRRFGTVPHAGFGLGFERLLLFVTGMTNIRDVIPFPRTPQNAKF
jgi:asparaginyl-tRNA synthetase